MKNEIKEGEYVRTKDGHIFKTDKENKNIQINEFINIGGVRDIVKHSPNIIDLIEIRRLCKWRKSNRNKRMELFKRWIF